MYRKMGLIFSSSLVPVGIPATARGIENPTQDHLIGLMPFSVPLEAMAALFLSWVRLNPMVECTVHRPGDQGQR